MQFDISSKYVQTRRRLHRAKTETVTWMNYLEIQSSVLQKLQVQCYDKMVSLGIVIALMIFYFYYKISSTDRQVMKKFRLNV